MASESEKITRDGGCGIANNAGLIAFIHLNPISRFRDSSVALVDCMNNDSMMMHQAAKSGIRIGVYPIAVEVNKMTRHPVRTKHGESPE
jgi:hypothetical protein